MSCMARMRDVPKVLRSVGVFGFAKRVHQQIGEDNVFTWGAALAYSWMFAIFPFLVFLLSLVPLIPERFKPNVREDIHHAVDQVLTGGAASALKTQIDGVLGRQSASGFLSFGLLLTIWAASGGMSMTMYALDKAYDIEKGRAFWKHRLIAIGLTLVVATLMILVMILLPVGTGVTRWMLRNEMVGDLAVIAINTFRYTIALALMFILLAVIYHFGPSFRSKFQSITPGAVFTVAVWVLLGFAFRMYLTKFGGADSYDKMYGAVAGAVILLLLFYLDAVVLLVGAEINSEIDFALLGIPSGGVKPEVAEQQAAPPDPELRQLARELEEKRSPHAPAPATSPPA